MGDNAVTEGWAMLLEHLTIDPVWLERRLDFPRPREYAAEGAVQLLWMLRRYCAKLLYELELQSSGDVASLRPRYVELLSEALKVTPSDTDYLDDVDQGFYSSEYLRAWAFEAQLRGVSARALRQRVVHATGGRLAPARAVERRAEADGGRDPRGDERRQPRARGCC